MSQAQVWDRHGNATRAADVLQTFGHYATPHTPIHALGYVSCIGLLLLGAGTVVYLTGGTKFAYAHLFYIPILLGAFFFNIRGGLLTALLAALIAGPWMPLDVATGTAQSTTNWLGRLGLFALVGTMAGVLMRALKAQQDALLRAGFQDPTTDLPNKAALLEHLAAAADEATHTGKSITLLLIHTEGYEEVGTSLGAQVADRLLREVAKRLAHRLDRGLRLYSLEGGRFALFTDAPAQEDIRPLVLDLEATFGRPFIADALPIIVELSCGIAHFPQHGKEPHTLLRAAQHAVQDAMHAGRSYAVYDPTLIKRKRESFHVVSELGRALANPEEITLHYQPKLDLTTGECYGVEALVRWQHPTAGLISPARFIPIAEKTALLKPLTEAVLDQALHQLAFWRKTGRRLLISINLSVRNLEDPELLRTVRGLLERHAVDPRWIEFEITESSLMQRPGEVLDRLGQLKVLGVTLAIDDFGTGHSSLAYLKDLPVDVLKIDQTFIRTVAQNRKDQAIVNAAIAMAKQLGIRTVAEGLEDAASLHWLSSVGCDAVQGFYLSPPLPAPALERWLDERAQVRPSAARHRLQGGPDETLM